MKRWTKREASIWERYQEWRHGSGYAFTLVQIASFAGLSASTISGWEYYRRSPQLASLLKLKDMLDAWDEREAKRRERMAQDDGEATAAEKKLVHIHGGASNHTLCGVLRAWWVDTAEPSTGAPLEGPRRVVYAPEVKSVPGSLWRLKDHAPSDYCGICWCSLPPSDAEEATRDWNGRHPAPKGQPPCCAGVRS